MKKYQKYGLILAVVIAIIGGIAFYLNKLSQDGVLNMADVFATIQKVSVYLIPLGILIVLVIAALIIFRKKNQTFKFWLKWESFIGIVVALVITLNVIFFGPMASLFNLNYAELGTVKAQTLKSNGSLTESLANEGTVLLKNEGNLLPLQKTTKKLNVFGWASTNPVYGGTGSGNVDTANATDILDSLTDAGYQTNKELSRFYQSYRKDRPVVGMWAQDWTLVEPKVSDYKDNLLQDAKSFSNTAVVVLGRVGGEGADLPTDMTAKGVTYKGNKGDFEPGQHYLELSKSEKDMIRMVNDNFENVIVLVNSANAMELGWLNDYSHVKAALWMAGPGSTGFSALGKILNGEVNPSGRTVDTYVYDLTKTPTWNNFGHFKYKDDNYTYVNYAEGIYVGYKFYETYYENDENGYNQTVQFPFGYGLSYTSFDQKMGNLSTDNQGNITASVTVTNTGNYSGKDVVQLYVNPPYQNGGIEKASANLVAFDKTKELKPGESQTIDFQLNQEDFASYDENHSQAYVLDKGVYRIQLKSNSHKLISEQQYNVPKTIVYDAANKRSTDGVAPTNQFKDYTESTVTFLSRKGHFENYSQSTSLPKDQTLSKEDKKELVNATTYKNVNNNKDKMPTTNAKNGLSLVDLKGLKYEDPKWDKLLDQLSVKDMSNLISYGGYQTLALNSVDKQHTYDFDGPAGLSSFFVQVKTTAFPSATLIAATWNKELANERGKAVGEEAAELGLAGWYGPAMNIHRSAFAGRNFEYYSEDGLLSGEMAAKEISGAKSKGVYAYMKHFALNDQETNRLGLLLTWSTEQAIREVYLKPFEMAVKDGGATAVMSSFNYIGNKWAGGNDHLLNNVLRDEWGFRGFVSTDYFGGYGFMTADQAVRNGNDIMLSTTGESGAGLVDTSSATAVKAMRTAAHNVLYTVVNSRAYGKNVTTNSILLPWQKFVIKIDAAIIIVLLLIQASVIVFAIRKRKQV